MNLHLNLSAIISGIIRISGSKSETNRLLILKALFPGISLSNNSDSDDSFLLQKAIDSDENVIDIGHAGTAMRFLTAYFAIQEGRTVILTGSERMKERPIKILVDALRELGADISYLESEGYPPLKITGRKFTKNTILLKADISSQYISALLLIAPKLENGLEIVLEGEIISRPYIGMTLGLLNKIGLRTKFEGNKIMVPHQLSIINYPLSIESDWSAASYFYSIIALSEPGTQLTLSDFNKESLQGDSALAEIYMSFGVETTFKGNKITICKTNCQLSNINFPLSDTPDIAQTIAVTCFGLGIACTLTGLGNLKIKETDRLAALKAELIKLGGDVSITDNSLTLKESKTIKTGIRIKTYNDHRMAMAFAPLALKVPIIIENVSVVSKSYPEFWEDLKQIGFKMSKIK